MQKADIEIKRKEELQQQKEQVQQQLEDLQHQQNAAKASPKRTKSLAGKTTRSSPLKGAKLVQKQANSVKSADKTHGGIIKPFKPPAKIGPLGVEYEAFVGEKEQQYTSLRKLEVARRKIMKD